MGPRHYQVRLPTRVYLSSPHKGPGPCDPPPHRSTQGRGLAKRVGGSKTKASYYTTTKDIKQAVHVYLLPCPQKGQQVATYIQSSSTEPPNKTTQVQNGNAPLHSSGHSDLHVLGRLAHSRSRLRHGQAAHGRGSPDREPSRMVSEQREIRSRAVATSNVSGNTSRLPERQSPSHNRTSPRRAGGRESSIGTPLSSGSSVASLSRLFSKPGRRSPVVPLSHEGPPVPLTGVFRPIAPEPRNTSPPDTISGPPHTVVVRPIPSAARESVPASATVGRVDHGRISDGLGSAFRRVGGRRPLEHQLAATTHQFARTRSSPSGTRSLPPPNQEQVRASPHRQYDGSGVHKSPRGDALEAPMESDTITTRVVHEVPSFPAGSSPAGLTELNSRQTVPTSGIPHGVVPIAGTSHEAVEPRGPSGRRSVCVHCKSQASNFLCSHAGPGGLGRRRVHRQLVPLRGIRIPSLLPRASSASEGRGRRLSDVHSHRPQLAGADLVSPLAPLARRGTLQVPGSSGPVINTGNRRVPPSPERPSLDCVATVRQSLVSQGLSKEAATLAANSRRPSTLDMYSSRLGMFRRWCEGRKISPTSAPIGDVADFLLEQFNQGKAINTVKGFCTAIAAIHSGFPDGSTVSTAKPLELLLRGMYLQRPTTRVLAPPWSMNVVLRALARAPFEPIQNCPLFELSIKTAFLLAAASGRRRGAIHALSLKDGHIRFEETGVRLLPDPSFIAKNQTLNFLPDSIFLPRLSQFSGSRDDDVWCPVRCLKHYIKKTQSIRGACSSLFISSQRPLGAVSRDTISRWIVRAILVDPDALFTSGNARAHQVRAMAASIALFRGVSLDEILSAAAWKTPTTFVAAYLRDVAQSSGHFARAVLSTDSSRQ